MPLKISILIFRTLPLVDMADMTLAYEDDNWVLVDDLLVRMVSSRMMKFGQYSEAEFWS